MPRQGLLRASDGSGLMTNRVGDERVVGPHTGKGPDDRRSAVLRAGRFATNSLGWAPEIRAGDVVRLPNAAAGRSPIDPRDVAAVAVRALVDAGHTGATHVLTGPERLTEREMVHVVGEVIGRTLRVEEVPPETARRELLDGGASPELADAALAYWAKLVAEPEPITRTVEEITGSPARTFREWATEHADDLR